MFAFILFPFLLWRGGGDRSRCLLAKSNVAYPDQFNADPDPTSHIEGDPIRI